MRFFTVFADDQSLYIAVRIFGKTIVLWKIR